MVWTSSGTPYSSAKAWCDGFRIAEPYRPIVGDQRTINVNLVLEDSLAKYRCFRNCATVVCGRAMSAWLDSCAFALRNLIQDVVGVSYCQITQLAWKIRISTKSLPLKSQETKLRQSSGRIVICCRRCWISERRLSRWNVSHPSGRTDSRRKFTPSASALAANMGA